MKYKFSSLIFLFFVTNSQVAKAQTKQDTLILLQQIGTFYLNTMYRDKNFDSAYRMWDKEMFLNLQLYIDVKSKGLIKDTNILVKKIRSNMINYYKKIDNFKLVEFTGNILTPNSPGMYMLRYLYTADFEKNHQHNEAELIIYFNKSKNNWTISDPRLVIIIMRIVQHYHWKELL